MAIADKIVDSLVEEINRDIVFREITAALEKERMENYLKSRPNMSIPFGWSIGTGSQEEIENNLDERGINPDTIDWNKANLDFLKIEHNLTKILIKNGLRLRPEGHGNDDNLVGVGWLDTLKTDDLSDELNKTGIDLVKSLLDSGEGLTTGSGSIMALEGSDQIFSGVSPEIADAAEVSFNLFGTEELSRFIDALDSGSDLEEFIEESFLAPREPSGIFRKLVGGVEIFSARCPGCKRIHGNFRTYDEAAGNRQCKFCTRDYVDKMIKVSNTGNFKNLLKKDHETRASRRYR